MSDALLRPDAVPPSAHWSPESGQWEERSHDLQGLPIGSVRAWRADGSLAFEAFYDHGELRGPFRRFHPDGRVAREGFYINGHLDGIVVAYASGDGRGEPLRGCCVPSGATRMEARYEQGGLRGETFFDDEGHVLLSDGSRRPPRPRHVPDEARFDESTRRWFDGAHDPQTGNSTGTWSWWLQEGADGRLDEEVDYEQGRRVATRRFDADGEVVEFTSLLRHDEFEAIPHGPWRRLLQGEEVQSWGGAAVHAKAWIEGEFDHKQSVGAWSLRTPQGAVLWARDLGLAVTDDVITQSAAFADEARSKSEWLTLASELRAQGRLREWIVARSRAVAAGADAEGFMREVGAAVLPKSEAAQVSEAQACADVQDLVKLLDALVTGAHTHHVLRLLCSALPAWQAAARDLSEACVRLVPDDLRGYLTRALTLLERGDDAGLRADLQRLAAVSADATSFFDETLAVFRPTYAFAPRLHAFLPLDEAVALEVAQPLEAVLQVASVYATRLLAMRQALARFGVADVAWAPPHLPAFLPQGPAPLHKGEAIIEDEDEQGQAEQTVVQIDECLPPLLGVSGIIGRARADWAGLCWLLWAVGLDEVAVPTRVQQRQEFPQALALVVERAWRARDQMVTTGLRSMTQGVADFEWEGHAVSALSPSFLQVCLDEWLEARAVLLWLSNAGNISPFQDDLRRV